MSEITANCLQELCAFSELPVFIPPLYNNDIRNYKHQLCFDQQRKSSHV